MDVRAAQAEQRRAYMGGGVGAVVSGLVWLAAGIVTAVAGLGAGFTALFFRGFVIFPATALLCRHALRRPAPSRENPLGRTALESTIAMIGTLVVAALLVSIRPDLVLPVAALAVGTHYFAFATVYGDMTYWAFGGPIVAIAVMGALGVLPSLAPPAFCVAAAEAAFGLYLALAARRA